jgi:hypothetical protein
MREQAFKGLRTIMIKKTAGYILLLFCFLTTFAYAQEWPSADKIVAKMKTEMSLDADQSPLVKLIVEENMSKRQDLLPQSTKGLSESQSHPLDWELYVKLSEVLTRSQMSQWNTTRRHMLQDVPGGGNFNK